MSDFSKFFRGLCSDRHNDNAPIQTLIEVVERVLGGLTVRDMIELDQEEFDYDGEGIWPDILYLESIAYSYPYDFPNWQLKMASQRLERLIKLIVNKA